MLPSENWHALNFYFLKIFFSNTSTRSSFFVGQCDFIYTEDTFFVFTFFLLLLLFIFIHPFIF